MAPPVKILLAALFIVLAVVLREIAFDPVWSLRSHFRAVNRLDAKEIRWREIRAGMVQPITREEKEIKELSEYRFEKKIYWMWRAYPKGQDIAQSKWSKFVDPTKFTTIEVDEEDDNSGNPSPNINLGVIYNRKSNS